MKQKQFTLINRGMNRDLSVSKTGESSAFENMNIRITATGNDTLLSVTNERGNKEVPLSSDILGTLLGWNVLNNHVILFTHYEDSDTPSNKYDLIYRIDYENDTFSFVGTKGPESNALYSGNLGFDVECPIESVVYFETDGVQKIYWVDGKNVLRFMNFMAVNSEPDVYAAWNDTTFDSNRAADFGVEVGITKDNSGNTRANGISQYLITYFNKHGQETGYVWMSDIVYLSPIDRGGAADSTNNNSITLTITNLDTSFSYFRVYSIFRSSLDGETVSYLVAEHKTAKGIVTVIDDGAHLVLQDATRLLYLGSQAVKAGTIEHKDQTLFLGDLKSIGRSDYNALEKVLRDWMFGEWDENAGVIRHCSFVPDETYLSCRIHFEYSDNGSSAPDGISDIPYPENEGNYPYESQLKLTSSEILTFKGGEKYRFALKFKCADGTETDAFWIGDAENSLYPVIDCSNKVIKRAVAVCKMPEAVVKFLQDSSMNYRTVQLLIAEATYADRSVKAQGIVNPTMFNVWERYNRRTYSIPSWISRIRGSNIANMHFSPVKNSTSSYGEIQCNYWESNEDKTPYYRYNKYDSKPEYTEEFEGKSRFNDIMIVYTINNLGHRYYVDVVVIKGIVYGSAEQTMLRHQFTDERFPEFKPYTSSTSDEDKTGWLFCDYKQSEQLQYTLELYKKSLTKSRFMNHGAARGALYTALYDFLTRVLGIPDYFIVKRDMFMTWCKEVRHRDKKISYNDQYPNLGQNSVLSALNIDNMSQARWQSEGDHNIGASYGDETPAFFKKHLMFVDENVITLDSPELSYNAVSIDNTDYKFRIVGVAKQTSVISDYTIDATNSSVSGTNYDKETFSGSIATRGSRLDGIIAWPLWKDYGLYLTDDAKSKEANMNLDEDARTKKRTSSDYSQGKNIVRYWMYLWQHAGSISGYIIDEEDGNENKSILKSKVFANQYNEYSTIYFNNRFEYPNGIDSIRQVSEFSNNEILLTIGDEKRYYSASPEISLGMPADLKYPILFSQSRPIQTNQELDGLADSPYLYSSAPVLLNYRTQGHAVISLHTDTSEEGYYTQDILPRIFDDEIIAIPNRNTSSKETGALIPWIYDENRYNYAKVEGVTVPIFNEINVSEIKKCVTLEKRFVEEPSEHRPDPEFYSIWEAIIENFGGEDVYSFVETNTYIYFVRINDVVRTVSVRSNPMFRIVLEEAPYISRIRKTSSEDKLVLVNVNAGSVTNLSQDAPAVVSTTSQGSAQMNLRTEILTFRQYPFRDYKVYQPDLSDYSANDSHSDFIGPVDKYIFIGEVYKDFGTGSSDTRYGGITLSDVETNRFIAAGPQYLIENMEADDTDVIYGNQGDTYFQRWDALRVMPASKSAPNGVIDISSVMLETHLNLDGRTDMQRGITEIASIDTATYGTLNTVYAQHNNFVLKRDLDEDFNTDVYRSSLTWTQPKADLADVDEWTHITLANTLKLDGDKGICRALHRLQNSLIAFQDKGISEILYNSRTQLSTPDGVPVELANSGKVDGKRYLTNKYGCVNKWSIVEGKSGLYFIDGINKAFCVANFVKEGKLSIENLSAKLGFSSWFRNNNSIKPWTPMNNAESIVSFYDRINSDVYLVKTAITDQPCLAFSEQLGVFSSFYSYGDVPMMVNVEDKFISFKNRKLWLQNEGLYCNFFDTQADFYVQYRVSPNPLTDKIWTNIDYRADFYKVLNADGSDALQRNEDLTDIDEWTYQKEETFDVLRVWNEYQDTGENKCRPIKKFRIWRYDIPRSLPSGTNRFGLDRIRNPWVNIFFKKKYDDDSDSNRDLMQLHDVTLTYFE